MVEEKTVRTLRKQRELSNEQLKLGGSKKANGTSRLETPAKNGITWCPGKRDGLKNETIILKSQDCHLLPEGLSAEH